MDKNKIKFFAVWARTSLISAITDRAKYIGLYIDKNGEFKEITAEKVQGGFKFKNIDGVFNLSYEDRAVLVKRINSYDDKKKGFEQVIEAVAYTWFNRFMGLRYMEVNDYLPIGVRILSSELHDKTEPDALTKVYSLIEELNLDINKVDRLLSDIDENGNEKNSIQKQSNTRELYKYILVRQCNELGKIIPQMFESISDYTELLLPDNLLEEGSVIRRMVEDINESDFREEKSLVEEKNTENKKTGGVEIIGWMYQYYISEKKDEVFAALKKNVKITKENIPAATQLFTPKWIVKYMVENSLGRLWLEGHQNEELQKEWKYYLEEAQQEPEVEKEFKKIREEHSKLKPEDIKVLDPCMGSGHILVYAFDVLYEIYKTAGYSERGIPRMILQNNLYGLDIDDRAAQLASFALIMKARHYNRRLFREIERENLELNVCSIQESNSIHKEAIDYFCSLETGLDNDNLENDLKYLWSTFIDAKEYGSILEVEKVNFEALKQRLKEIEQVENFMFGDYRKMLLDKLPIIIKQAEIMSRKYEVCVTNPPYMGYRNINSRLKKVIDDKYDDVKMDMFTVFMVRIFNLTKINGFSGFMTPIVWMFISSYKKLRENMINNNTIVSLIQLEQSAFQDAAVSICSFIIQNNSLGLSGEYIRLTDFQGANNQEIQALEAISEKNLSYRYQSKMDAYNIIPDNKIAYWISKTVKELFINYPELKEIAKPVVGMQTSDNNRFVRYWNEVSVDKIGFAINNQESANLLNYKWYPYNKGGSYRKWYGNNEFVVNWGNDGFEVKEYAKSLYGNYTRSIKNIPYYYKEGLTWCIFGYNNFGVRYKKKGFIFDISGASSFPTKENMLYILGLLGSKVALELLSIIAPTVNFQVGDISKIPIIMNGDLEKKTKIDRLVETNIKISEVEWDSYEISWDFRMHPLLKLLDKGQQYKLSSIFAIWETKCDEAFDQLKYNEEELNRIFIDIYGLQDELTPEVEDKDVTIRKADREIDIKSFISYAVGCMLGRYSIDAEGLIYAGGEWDDKWIVENGELKVRKQVKNEDGEIVVDEWVHATFMPDLDNVIPITEDEYFEDDIVSRFIEFVRTVYGEETLEENLDFIADSIGRKPSETARQAIRRYFIKDFYKDHLKVYQKRPIYWMFESGKNNGFKALVYMHRYNEQTVAKIRTDYLHTLQRKYEAEVQRQQLIVDSEEYSAKERTASKKKIARIAKQIEECREYDQVVAHLANEKKSIDLDDGVKINYAKFQGIKVINSKDKEVKMNLLAKI